MRMAADEAAAIARALPTQDRTARVWDAASGEQRLSLAGHAQSVTAVAFCPMQRGSTSCLATGSKASFPPPNCMADRASGGRRAHENERTCPCVDGICPSAGRTTR